MKRRSGTTATVVIGGLVIIFVILLVSPHDSRATSDLSPNSPNTSDYYDPNDSFYTATYISDGLISSLDVSSSDTEDYFSVYVSSNYQLVVGIDWYTSADLDLFLYDSYHNQIDSSSSISNWYEDVSYNVQTSGQYYILVKYYSGSGTISYSMNVETSNYVDQFSPILFMSIFIPIVIIVTIVIIVAVAVHQYNKNQRVIHPSTVRPPPPILQGPQPTVGYAPTQPSSYTPSYAPSYAPSYTQPISQQPVVNVAPPKPESKGRFCIGCGEKLEPTQRFCHNCGMENDAKQ